MDNKTLIDWGGISATFVFCAKKVLSFLNLYQKVEVLEDKDEEQDERFENFSNEQKANFDKLDKKIDDSIKDLRKDVKDDLNAMENRIINNLSNTVELALQKQRIRRTDGVAEDILNKIVGLINSKQGE
ncbi:hypothetical protein [Methanococcus maripaludis]|uniref:Uncharacterized protein n=1 Tax=Methanococcus maripaludis TaxID=39152 RepID=A0A7J9NV50_METMI|nr:hypothetical protein [Methanococcus maripaludis]MBA2851549.1 hypothetical protein [Methanococcus maripaludis]MBG0769677.1 hypothetical protein [Methanococcus maripaludis]